MEVFYDSFLDINRKAMLILSAWAVLNFLTSSFWLFRSKGMNKYFHQMNIGWNLVNVAIVIFSLYGIEPNPTITSQFLVEEQSFIERFLFLNIGLDCAYMALGWGMIQRSLHLQKNPLRLRGFGKSLLIQGGFLFLFDLGYFSFHFVHGKGLWQVFAL